MALIYHYTNAAALIGMLSASKEEDAKMTMWATHSQFLNDPSEYEYGKEVSQKILREIEEELKIEEPQRLSSFMYDESRKQYFKDWEHGLSRFPDSLSIATPFVISFTRHLDYLPMWTSYGKNGNGIAIGIERDVLNEKNNMFSVRNCHYDIEDEGFSNIREQIKMRYEMLQQTTNGADEGETYVCQLDFIMMLNSQVAAYIKHPSYRYEGEVRCKVAKADEIKFRESNGLVVPYVEVDIPVESIKEIVIGPTLDAERMKLSIDLLLKTRGLRQVEIKESSIPYRG